MNKNTFITSVDNISLKLDNAEGISLVHSSDVQRQIPTVIFTFVSWKIYSSGTATVAHSIIMLGWHQSEPTNVNGNVIDFCHSRWLGQVKRSWPPKMTSVSPWKKPRDSMVGDGSLKNRPRRNDGGTRTQDLATTETQKTTEYSSSGWHLVDSVVSFN